MRAPGLVLTLALVASHACSGGPAAPTRACRTWPLRYSDGRTTFTCEASSTTPSCSAFPVNLTITWGYRSRSDFVHEGDVPNRVLALGQSSRGCGTFVTTGCNTNQVAYEYDSQGRLVRRERSWSHTLGGGGTIDVVTYSAWDRRGRPTEGRIEANGQGAPLSITYDDGRRIAESSNGELVEQDVHGNVVREVQVRGGTVLEVLYTIESYQPVCEAAP
jgi:hypothetical protein